MKKIIAIIGAGQLGSRHLQSLAVLDKELFEIFVFDTQRSSLDIAYQRYCDVSRDSSPEVFVTDVFQELPKEIYTVIVATSSIVRRKVVEQLLEYAQVEFLILEKFLFTRLEDFSDVEKLLEQYQIKAFVNTPRRTFEFYKKIAVKIDFPFQMEVAGSQWGLGCNAIHFLDLFFYLNQSTSFEVIPNLDEEVFSSKRDGYIEFTGAFIMKDDKKNTCQITSFKEGNLPVVVSLTDSKQKWTIHENLGIIRTFEMTDTGYGYQESAIRIPFQSESTAKIITDLLNTGDCMITNYKDSAYLHQKLLVKYLDQYSAFLNQKADSCPIT